MPPRYRILETSFIDNKLVKAGEEIESDETPAAHWEPLDKPAKSASKTAAAEEAARVEAGQLDVAARAAATAAATLPALPAQEIARLDAEAEAATQVAAAEIEAAAQAAADAEEHKEDPLA